MAVPGGTRDGVGERLLTQVTVVLAATAALALLLSFFAAGPFEPLRGAPSAVRFGITALLAGFIALVFEERRRQERVRLERAHQVSVEDALYNRLKVIAALVEGPDRLTALSLEDVLRVLLRSAVDAAGAESGTLDYFEQKGDDLAVTQSVSTNPGRAGARPSHPVVEITLSVEERLVGLLTLNLPKGAKPIAPPILHALETFGGQAARLIVTAQNVSMEKASAAYLEASNLVKSRFLTTISHELRTPLTSIIGYSKTLDNHWNRLNEEQKRDFVREIEKQSGRLARLVERILEAARVELQGIVIEPVEHDVRTSVQKAIAPFMATDPDRLNLALPERPIEAEIDPFVIDQVLSNLVDNALRYTTGQVRISLDSYRSSVTIAVTDQGEGIDPKQLNLVLEPLYRIDENIQSGTGLGLHIVRTLVESHGGRGEIRSGATGTSIAIKLPRTTGSRISGKVAKPAARSVRAI